MGFDECTEPCCLCAGVSVVDYISLQHGSLRRNAWWNRALGDDDYERHHRWWRAGEPDQQRDEPTGQFIGQLNLLFTTQPTGSNFSSDPYVQSISLGNFTDAGLGFNVKVRFKVAPPGARLLPGGISTFTLSGVSTSDFAGLNTSAMVHIQNIPPGGDSSKVIAPEPGSLIAIGTGLVSLLGLRRRRK